MAEFCGTERITYSADYREHPGSLWSSRYFPVIMGHRGTFPIISFVSRRSMRKNHPRFLRLA